MDYLDAKTLHRVASVFHNPAMFLAEPHMVKAWGATFNDTELINGTAPGEGEEEEELDPTLLTVYNILVILQVGKFDNLFHSFFYIFMLTV